MDNELAQFLNTLSDKEWYAMVDDKWTVKDVVAHIVGWERECAKQLPIIWQTKQKPWFVEETNWDEFNKVAVADYKDFSPKQLMAEWEKWINETQKEVNTIGEDNMKARPDLFFWYFEGTDFDETGVDHYTEHLRQLKEVLHK